jgi:hypothetical protein
MYTTVRPSIVEIKPAPAGILKEVPGASQTLRERSKANEGVFAFSENGVRKQLDEKEIPNIAKTSFCSNEDVICVFFVMMKGFCYPSTSYCSLVAV